RGLQLSQATQFEALPGLGLTAMVDGHALVIGNAALLQASRVSLDGLRDEAEVLANQGKTATYVAVDGQPAGLVAAADQPRPTARAAIARLKDLGLQVVMISGDNQRTADAIGRQLGIDRILAQVLPQDKASYIKRLQDEGQRMAMVG